MKSTRASEQQRAGHQTKEIHAQTVLLTIRQVAETLGIGQTKAYALLREGLPVIRVGRALRVSCATLQEWIEQHEQAYSQNTH
jgi:excisionase family DNA binding protein